MKLRHFSGSALMLCLAMAAAGLGSEAAAAGGECVAVSPSDSVSSRAWNAGQLVQPDALAKQLHGPAASRPLLLCVGFDFLYQSAHIAGAILYGPARNASGLKTLEDAARTWPRNREIVIYCGCCPMKQCPNLLPAFRALENMGFTRLRVLDLDHDFRQDWLQKGFPVERARPQ